MDEEMDTNILIDEDCNMSHSGDVNAAKREVKG